VQLSWLDRDVPARPPRKCKKIEQVRDVEIIHDDPQEGER